MKIEMTGDNFLLTLTLSEMLVLINGLAGRQLLIRDIAGVIAPSAKKSDVELNKIHKALVEGIPPEAWDKKKPFGDNSNPTALSDQ